MPRISQTAQKRQQLLPVVARVFTELGYRRTTTAELAARCRVQENILYRLWPDKKAMFLAAIDYVYEFSEQTWLRLLAESNGSTTPAQKLIEYEAAHHGEFGHYRILFSGLGEADDAEIRAALRRTFARFHRFLLGQLLAQAPRNGDPPAVAADLSAWAVIGLGTIANIGRELDLLDDVERRRLIGEVSERLLAAAKS